METARYKAFLASAEEGSFSKAAEKLCYTASGVSQLVSALEGELGFPLLSRSRKGVVPTANGEMLLPAIRSFLQQEEYICQMAAELNGLQIGSVTIATYFSIATHWLPRVIRDFQKKYPNIEVRLLEGTRREIENRLENRQADMAFMSYLEPMAFDWIPLAEEAMLAILPMEHPLAGETVYPLSYCGKDKFIMPERGADDDVMSMLRKNGVEPNICFSTRESFAAVPLVEQGIGISIMNELLTKRWEYDVKKLPLDPPQKITLGIAALDLDGLSPASKRFLKFAVEELTCREEEVSS